jgi:hypothetical protein
MLFTDTTCRLLLARTVSPSLKTVMMTLINARLAFCPGRPLVELDPTASSTTVLSFSPNLSQSPLSVPPVDLSPLPTRTQPPSQPRTPVLASLSPILAVLSGVPTTSRPAASSPRPSPIATLRSHSSTLRLMSVLLQRSTRLSSALARRTAIRRWRSKREGRERGEVIALPLMGNLRYLFSITFFWFYFSFPISWILDLRQGDEPVSARFGALYIFTYFCK